MFGRLLPAFLDRDLHELADAGLIERGERVLLEDLVLDVRHEEVAHVVAADAERHLREVVRAEAEELGALRDFIRRERAARHFDHGADQVVELHLLLRHHLLRDAMDDLGLEIELLLEPDERDHDLRLHLDLLLRDIGRRFEDGARLHLGDLGIGDAEAAAAMTEHRIEFVQLLDALRDLLRADADLLRRDRPVIFASCGRNSWSGGSRKRIVAG